MYIYLIKNNKEGHERFGWQYIGQRTIDVDSEPEDDYKYMGSSKLLKKDIKELGLEFFSKEILEPICITKEHLNDKEVYWIAKYNTYLGIGYNQSFGGVGGDFTTNHPEYSLIVDKMKQNPKKKIALQKARKIAAENKKKTYTITTPDNVVESIKGLREYCKKNNLDAGNMLRAAKNIKGCKQHKGYKIQEGEVSI